MENEEDYKQKIISYMYHNMKLYFDSYASNIYHRPETRYKHNNPNFDEQLEEYNKHYFAAKNEVDTLERELIIVKGFDKNSNLDTYELTDKFREELKEFKGDFRRYGVVNNERKKQKEDNDRIAIEKAKLQEEKEHKKERRQISFNTATTFFAVLGLLIQSVIGLYEVFKPEPKIIIHTTDSLLNYNIEVLQSIDANINKLVKFQDSILKSKVNKLDSIPTAK